MQNQKLSMIFAMALLLVSTSRALAQPPGVRYEVVNTYTHDTSAFRQGLILVDGKLYESTGLYGQSSLREVNLQTGAVLRKIDTDPQYFAEGMTIFQGRIFS